MQDLGNTQYFRVQAEPENGVKIMSAVNDESRAQIEALAEELCK